MGSGDKGHGHLTSMSMAMLLIADNQPFNIVQFTLESYI